MAEHNILFLLIQIDEAHSSEWPAGLPTQPEPHMNIEDRLLRANEFVINEKVPFKTFVDVWSNNFASTYHAWPDKYFMTDKNLKILEMSIYGTDKENTDALVQNDCLDLIYNLIDNA